jgi:hypothetical protein
MKGKLQKVVTLAKAIAERENTEEERPRYCEYCEQLSRAHNQTRIIAEIAQTERLFASEDLTMIELKKMTPEMKGKTTL